MCLANDSELVRLKLRKEADTVIEIRKSAIAPNERPNTPEEASESGLTIDLLEPVAFA